MGPGTHPPLSFSNSWAHVLVPENYVSRPPLKPRTKPEGQKQPRSREQSDMCIFLIIPLKGICLSSISSFFFSGPELPLSEGGQLASATHMGTTYWEKAEQQNRRSPGTWMRSWSRAACPSLTTCWNCHMKNVPPTLFKPLLFCYLLKQPNNIQTSVHATEYSRDIKKNKVVL